MLYWLKNLYSMTIYEDLNVSDLQQMGELAQG